MPQTPARERKSSSDVARNRAAIRDMAAAMVTLIVLNGSLVVLDPHGEVTGWYVAWSLSPVIPFLWLMWAQLKSLRRADEYQRIIQLEAMAIGFGTVLLLSMVAGLLEGARMGDPRQSLQIITIGGFLVWGGALAVLTRRSG
jgi:peptidoglycan/LPS O-acetylase OafA/YrhL